MTNTPPLIPFQSRKIRPAFEGLQNTKHILRFGTKGVLLLLTSFLFLVACKKAPKGLITENAMVVSARVEASQIGSDILKKGGNAFDAMVATDLALAVAYPYAGNIGGGGFMVYRDKDGNLGGLDYREKAPLAATKDMYLDSLGNVIPGKSTDGATAVGVPGTIAGLFAVHKKFGSMPIEDLIQPAIDLAKRGVIVTKKQEKRIAKYQDKIIEISGDSVLFALSFKEGDTIKYNALANTLLELQSDGKAGFYSGETAQKLVDFLQKRGSLITVEDLEKYEAKWRKPIVFDYDDLKIISMSPPSSGGITIAQILTMVEPFDLKEAEHNTAEYVHILTEAERRAFADRNYFLGDPDFVNIPTQTLTNDTYLKDRMRSFDPDNSTSSDAVSHGSIEIVESDQTTHYSIVDSFGNAVSVTTTLNGAYGGKLYCDELGFFLNNEMDDFSSKPGVPNMFGLVGAEANSIAPEKRMLSSMTPTIVEKNGKLFMVVGTPGGSTIITTVAQVVLNVHEFEMGMQEAVNQPRFHHQHLPDEIRMEPDLFSDRVKRKLKKKGHTINEERTPVIGKVNAILVLPDGRFEGGADPRGDETAVGF